MAVVRGLAVSPNAGADRCHAVELALDLDDDYADAMAATVVAVCAHPAAYVWQGSGLCVVHRSRLKHEGVWSMN